MLGTLLNNLAYFSQSVDEAYDLEEETIPFYLRNKMSQLRVMAEGAPRNDGDLLGAKIPNAMHIRARGKSVDSVITGVVTVICI